MYTPYGLPKFERLRRRQRDETMDDKEKALGAERVADIRTWALDRAIREAPEGTIWEVIFGLAEKYTRYIVHGTYDTPVADAQAEDK